MKSRLLGAVCASILGFIAVIPTPAALIDNDGGLIQDDVLDITWAQPDSLRDWNDANSWAAGLTLGGVSGWWLPYICIDSGDLGCYVDRRFRLCFISTDRLRILSGSRLEIVYTSSLEARSDSPHTIVRINC
jgi:hypothetical protein